jgi:hypothetical protein
LAIEQSEFEVVRRWDVSEAGAHGNLKGLVARKPLFDAWIVAGHRHSLHHGRILGIGGAGPIQ